MPSKPRVSGWYVDLDGKKSGPYNVEEIRELFLTKRILGDQRVFSEMELPRPGEAAGERTTSKLLRVGELLDQYTDPALSLLDALQAARGQKRPLTPLNSQNAVAEDRNSPNAGASSSAPAASARGARLSRGVKNPDRKPDIPPQLAIFVATAMVAAAVVWGTLQLLKHSSTIMPPSQVAKDTDGIKSAPIGAEARSIPATAHAPMGTTAPPPPTAQPIVPSSGGFASRLKPRPFTRSGASVPAFGRPTPPEPTANNHDTEKDERDAAEQKEREEHDRDVHDAQDTGGGGGQQIDADPGQPAAAAGGDANNGQQQPPQPSGDAPPPADPNTTSQ